MTKIFDFYNRSNDKSGVKHHRRPGTRNINMDITNRCTLECVTCERQHRIAR